MDGWASRALSPGAHQPLGASLVGFFPDVAGRPPTSPPDADSTHGSKRRGAQAVRRPGKLSFFLLRNNPFVVLARANISVACTENSNYLCAGSCKKEGTLMAFLKVLSRQRLHH